MFALFHGFTSPYIKIKELCGIFDSEIIMFDTIDELFKKHQESGRFIGQDPKRGDSTVDKKNSVMTVFFVEKDYFLEFEIIRIIPNTLFGYVVNKEEKDVNPV